MCIVYPTVDDVNITEVKRHGKKQDIKRIFILEPHKQIGWGHSGRW